MASLDIEIEKALRRGPLSRDEILHIVREHPAIVSSSSHRAKGEKIRRTIVKMSNVAKSGSTKAATYHLIGANETNYNRELLTQANNLVTLALRKNNGSIENPMTDNEVFRGAIDILERRGIVDSGGSKCTGKAISFEPFEKKLTSFNLPGRSVEAIEQLGIGLKKMSDNNSEIKFLGIVPPSEPNKSTTVAIALEVLLQLVNQDRYFS